MMSNGEPNGFNGVYRAIRVAHDGERTRPACEGLHDLDDPHARSRRREPPLLVRTGVLDLGFVLAIAVLIALRDLDSFCRGAMERMRQLSRMVWLTSP